MIRATLSSLESEVSFDEVRHRGQLESVLPKVRNRTYTPLLQMQTCPSLEEAIAHRDERRNRTGRPQEQQQQSSEGD